MRTHKGNVRYYYDSDNHLIALAKGNSTLFFYYDNNGNPTSFSDGTNMYYYVKNIQGDIVKIISSTGAVVANYAYNVWGELLSVKDSFGNPITDQTSIAYLNPFRYRGYYLDTETGLYYLMSRYYDPLTHRFINADGYYQSGEEILDANMSAYCSNNPVNYRDPKGTKECPIHHEYWSPTCTICRPDYAPYKNVSHLYSKTTVTPSKSNSNNTSYDIVMDVNTLHVSWPSSQNYSPQQIKRVNELISFEVFNQSNEEVNLNYFEKAKMFGEIIIHLDGYLAWDVFCDGDKEDYLYVHCNTIDLSVVDGNITDNRWYINAASNIIGITTYWLL